MILLFPHEKLFNYNGLWFILANLVSINVHCFFAEFWENSSALDFGIVDSISFTKWRTHFIVH